MDRLFKQFAFFIDYKTQILIHVLSKEGNDRTHQNINFEQNVEKDVQTDLHVKIINFSF